MKINFIKISFIAVLAMAINFLHAQTISQPHLQLSKGGYPWSFKFTEFDSEVVYENMPYVDAAALQAEDDANAAAGSKVLRFGYDHYVSYKLTNSGVWHNLNNGDKIWRIGIASAGALTMNISFKSLNLPDGCRLFVYNGDKTEFHGAFTQEHVTPGDKMLGSELLSGEKVVVELYVPKSALDHVYLEIWRVTHAYKDLRYAVTRTFGASGSCENNARCPSYAAWDNQIRSGICLVNGGEFCSAALINNTCNDGKAYVLTANHCGSSGFGSWVFRFNWESTGCTTPGSSPSSNSISGGTQRAAYAGADMSLVEMNSVPPLSYNVYYAGWDRNNTAPTNPFGIHHPSGDIKKFSQTTGTGSSATYSGAACWQTPTWTDGVTEPGSSGSPLFNSSGLIIGQLYGGPSDCSCEGSASCGYDFYGKVFTSWTGGGTNPTRLSNWLDPCSTGTTTLSGYDPNASTVALDAGISSITSPENASTSCDPNFTPVVVLRNYGTTTLTTVNINYHLDAATPAVFAWTGSLASGSSTSVTLPAFTASVAAHTWTAYTSNPNGGVDGNATNDSNTNSFTVISAPTGTALPFTQGFDPVTFPPAGWTIINPDANVTWVRSTAASGYGASTASARFDNFSSATDISGESDYLETPVLDFTGTGTLNLLFDVAYARYDASYFDSLYVWITTDCGGTWTKIFGSGSTGLATAADNTSAFTPTATQWDTYTVDLSAYAGITSVQIRFENKSGWGNYLYLDNINISYPVMPVADFSGTPTMVCQGETVVFTNSTTGATSYSWTFGGGTPGSSTSASPTVTYNTPGTYNVTLVATSGAGSDTEVKTGYIVVNANPPTPTISNLAGTLSATPSTGYTYQWYLNGSPVSGANASTYTPAVNGNYTVEITDSLGCSALSAVTTFTGLFENSDAGGMIGVYPNPTQGLFTVTLNTNFGQDCDLAIYNGVGQLMFSKPVQFATGTRSFEMNVAGLAPGVYTLSITDGTKRYNHKLVIE
ncbi:MAG TPA: PKD domain-containing protein [Flavobacteriales bacterium]|nr:PKD domain-containing protein [Flavobacteriales bacterium]